MLSGGLDNKVNNFSEAGAAFINFISVDSFE